MVSLVFDHIGIIVKKLDKGVEQFRKFHANLSWSEVYEEPYQDVFVRFGADYNALRYEVIAPRSPNSPIMNSLKKNVNLLNHLAYRVPSMEEAQQYFSDCMSMLITQAHESNVFNNSLIQFWKIPHGLIYELIEDTSLR